LGFLPFVPDHLDPEIRRSVITSGMAGRSRRAPGLRLVRNHGHLPTC
jgi:hypothetical protein